MNMCMVIDTFTNTGMNISMHTSGGTMKHAYVLDVVFLTSGRVAIHSPVHKTMPVERVCILCREWLCGREWLFKSDCPTCLGEDSLKTPADYVRFWQLTLSTSNTAAEPTSRIRKLETSVATLQQEPAAKRSR
jgi:hypothetical protein